MAQMDWDRFAAKYRDLELYHFLERAPRTLLDGMLARGVNSPLASSCGRLFDAVAAAVGLVREHAWYEGQGAIELEAAVDRRALTDEDERHSYPFGIALQAGMPTIEPRAMWSALLDDLIRKVPLGLIAARFHRGLADVIVRMVDQLARDPALDTLPRPLVALSGGVFQNRVLFERVLARLSARGFTVLSHTQVPCNDGGLALGQAAIAAARLLRSA